MRKNVEAPHREPRPDLPAQAGRQTHPCGPRRRRRRRDSGAFRIRWWWRHRRRICVVVVVVVIIMLLCLGWAGWLADSGMCIGKPNLRICLEGGERQEIFSFDGNKKWKSSIAFKVLLLHTLLLLLFLLAYPPQHLFLLLYFFFFLYATRRYQEQQDRAVGEVGEKSRTFRSTSSFSDSHKCTASPAPGVADVAV